MLKSSFVDMLNTFQEDFMSLSWLKLLVWHLTAAASMGRYVRRKNVMKVSCTVIVPAILVMMLCRPSLQTATALLSSHPRYSLDIPSPFLLHSRYVDPSVCPYGIHHNTHFPYLLFNHFFHSSHMVVALLCLAAIPPHHFFRMFFIKSIFSHSLRHSTEILFGHFFSSLNKLEHLC